ncbi:hypothetical protein J1614_004481 [Plenodomus biglobosus]|nr:hypothetical protein J1614_004481 [Plenodomus biglobosus]
MDSSDNWAFGAVPYAAGVPHSGTPSSHSIPSTAFIIGGTVGVLGGWPLIISVTGLTAGNLVASAVAAKARATIGNVAAGSTFTIAPAMVNENVNDDDLGVVATRIGNGEKDVDCKVYNACKEGNEISKGEA